MATIGSIKIRIGGDITSLEKSLKRAEFRLQRSGRKLAELGSRLSAAITLPVLAIGGAALKTAGDLEGLKKGMESMMGSAEAAKKEIALLRKEALKPGLNFEQAIKGSVRLQAVGTDAELARRALAGFGNALALVGGTGEQLDGVTLALSQIASKGKISAEEINQLAERVPQIRAILKNAFGTADTEQLQDLGIGFEEFITKSIIELEKLPKAQSGIKNSIENTKLALQEASALIGERLFPIFEKVSKEVLRVVTAFTKLDSGLQDNIIKYALVAAAIGPALSTFGTLKIFIGATIGSFAKLAVFSKTTINTFSTMTATVSRLYVAFGQLSFAMKALTLSGVLIAVTAAIAGFSYLKSKIDEVRFGSSELAKVNDTLVEAQKQVAKETGREIRAIEESFSVLKNDTSNREEKRKAINLLLEQHPSYLKNIDLETASVDRLNQIQKDLTDNILKSVGARKKAEVLDKFYGKIIDKQLQLQKIQKEGFSALSFIDQFTTDPLGFFRKEGETGEQFAVRKAVEGLNQEIADLKDEAILTASAFDNLFNLGKRSGRNSPLAHLLDKNDKKVLDDLTTKKFKRNNETNSIVDLPDEIKTLDLIPNQLESNGLESVINRLTKEDFTQNFRKHIKKAQDSIAEFRKEFVVAVDVFNTQFARILEGGIEGALVSLGDTLGSVLAGSANGISLLATVLDSFAGIMVQVGKLAITTGFAIEGIKKALQTLNPITAIAGGIALVALGKLVSSKAQSLAAPKLASGGIVSGRTLVEVGEYAGANVNPEVIAPLDKLRSMIQPAGTGNITIDGEFRILGDELRALIRRADELGLRVSG